MPFANGSRRTSRWGSSSSASSSPRDETESVKRQIENAKLRINDAGFKVEDADRRNWFEKLTNLPSGQNSFFDALELLGRPGQAVLNTFDKKDENKLTTAWRGFAGLDRVRGADIAEKMGVDHNAGKAIIGTAIEIAADPISYIPGGAIAKGVKGVTSPVSRGFAKAYNAIEPNAVRRVREETINPAVSAAKDKLGYMFNPDYKATQTLLGGESDFLAKTFRDTENKRRFSQDEYTGRLLKVAQDTGLDAGEQVGRIMEAPLKQFEDVKTYRFPDGVRSTENKAELFTEIRKKRSDIKGVGKEIRSADRQYDEAIGEFAKQIDSTDREIRRIFTGLERQAGKEVNKETRQNIRELGRELAKIESQLNNFGNNEKSLLRYYKKLLREQHEGKFDILKRLKQYAPNGIKISGITKNDLPERLKKMVKEDGLNIEVVAGEMGYADYRDLLGDISALDGLSRKLPSNELESLARREMERTGALSDLSATRLSLEQAKDTMRQSLRGFAKNKSNSDIATERAFLAIENNPKYQELIAQREALQSSKDSLFGESRQATESRIQQIRQIEDEIHSLHEAARNPVMIQREIERPVRELSSDPRVIQAADDLLKSNNELRMWAEQEGIGIDELEGYMTHVLSAEERKARKSLTAKNIDRSLTGMKQPNKSILKQRKLTGSVEDINERLGKNLFEPNAYFATAIGQRRLIDYISAVSFRQKVLNNPDFAVKYQKGMKLPPESVVIDVNNYKFIKPAGDLLEGVATRDIGGQYVVTKAVKEKLDRYKIAMTDEGTKAFLNAFDSAQSVWKRMALFSIPYHLRNDIGAKFNAWVGGMNSWDIAKYTPQADKEVFEAMILDKQSALFKEYRKQGLSATSQSQVEFMRRGQDPEGAVEKLVKEGSKKLKGKIKDRLNPLRAFETSREFGDFVDQTNRFMMFKWAVDKGKTYDEAAKIVKESMFDYTNLTNFERGVMTRIVPFYRWTRNNLPYQMRQFINDPRKYMNLNKLRLNAQEVSGIDENNVPDWMKEGLYIPVYAKDGKGKMLGFNLPGGELGKLSEPLKLGIDTFTPLVKTPIELGTNFNMFYRKPIESFGGQKKQFSAFGKDFGIPIKTAYALEQMTGQIGRGFSGYLQRPEDEDQDKKFRTPKLGISGVLKDFDVEKANYYELRNHLRQLQDYINYIEQQEGVRPRTVNEIRR